MRGGVLLTHYQIFVQHPLVSLAINQYNALAPQGPKMSFIASLMGLEEQIPKSKRIT